MYCTWHRCTVHVVDFAMEPYTLSAALLFSGVQYTYIVDFCLEPISEFSMRYERGIEQAIHKSAYKKSEINTSSEYFTNTNTQYVCSSNAFILQIESDWRETVVGWHWVWGCNVHGWTCTSWLIVGTAKEVRVPRPNLQETDTRQIGFNSAVLKPNAPQIGYKFTQNVLGNR